MGSGVISVTKKAKKRKINGCGGGFWVYKGVVVIVREECALIRDTKLIICGRES